MDEALIVVSIISLIGTIIVVELMNHNWFKKERFKFDNTFQRKKYDLELKKIARDMGLTTSATSKNTTIPSTSSPAISPDMIAAAMNMMGMGGEEEGEGGAELPPGITDLIQWGLQNPDHPLVQGFTKGLRKQNNNTSEGGGDSGFM